MKKHIIALAGAISTLLGGIGTAIAAFGLCPCVLAPIFSIIGIASLAISFLSNNKTFFLVLGLVLLLVSLFFHKGKKTCKVHEKD